MRNRGLRAAELEQPLRGQTRPPDLAERPRPQAPEVPSEGLRPAGEIAAHSIRCTNSEQVNQLKAGKIRTTWQLLGTIRSSQVLEISKMIEQDRFKVIAHYT